MPIYQPNTNVYNRKQYVVKVKSVPSLVGGAPRCSPLCVLVQPAAPLQPTPTPAAPFHSCIATSTIVSCALHFGKYPALHSHNTIVYMPLQRRFAPLAHPLG